MAVKRRTGVCMPGPLSGVFENSEVDKAPENAGDEETQSAAAETPGKSFDIGEEEESDKFPPDEDDLPLGSEANTLASEILGNKFSSLIDKRLGMLKQTQGQTGSFDSINTTSSSINSVDMLLQERSEDPEQVLLNLGFAAGHNEMSNSMGRIPERFLLNQSHARGINLEEFLEDNPELKTFVGTLKKKGSRSGAWKAARSMSTVLYHLKMSAAASSTRQRQTPEPTAVEDARPRSILIPENQRALAKQGFYTQHLGFKSDKNTSDHSKAKTQDDKLLSITETTSETQPVAKDAASKRKIFGRTHSKKWCLVDDNEQDSRTVKPRGVSQDYFTSSFDNNFSLDFSTSASMDSSDCPFSPDTRYQSNPRLDCDFNRDNFEKIEDAYFPVSETTGHGIGEKRRLLVDSLLNDHGESYDVSPPMSKQSTVERVKTLSTGSVSEDVTKEQIKIVVSENVDSQKVENDEQEKEEGDDLDHLDKLNYLNIGLSVSDRLSDTESSSDYTVVDKQSTTSLESPEVMEQAGRKEVDSSDKIPDENENFPLFKFIKQSAVCQESPIIKSHIQDELSRMGSVQSDSSGFGDADNSVDVTPHEADGLKYLNPGSLGSSCESAATLVMSRDGDNSMPPPVSETDGETMGVPVYSWKRVLNKTVVSNSQAYPPMSSTPNPNSSGEKETYISMCYIPSLRKPRKPDVPEAKKMAAPGKDSNRIQDSVPIFRKNHVSIVVTGEKCVERQENLISESRHTIKSNSPNKTVKKDTLHLPPTEIYKCNTVPELSHSWLRSGSRRAQYFKSRFQYGSRDSILSESDISYCSTPESVASCNNSETMEYSKLIKLINQPVSIQGYKRSIIHYKPKKNVKEWPSLLRKKRLQEETSMLQYAIQKYKTELHSIETAFIIQFQQAYEELTDEERDEVEELQHLWTAIHQQLLETERLLSQRIKKINAGNDFFAFVSSLGVLHKMIMLLREQLYQQQVTVGKEELDMDTQSLIPPSRSHSYSGLDVPTSPFSPPNSWVSMASPSIRNGKSLDELRDCLINDMREELRKSTQNLHFDLQSKDFEIRRLQMELMMEKHSHQNLSLKPRVVKETDV